MTFFLAYLNVNVNFNVNILSMVHEYAYFLWIHLEMVYSLPFPLLLVVSLTSLPTSWQAGKEVSQPAPVNSLRLRLNQFPSLSIRSRPPSPWSPELGVCGSAVSSQSPRLRRIWCILASKYAIWWQAELSVYNVQLPYIADYVPAPPLVTTSVTSTKLSCVEPR